MMRGKFFIIILTAILIISGCSKAESDSDITKSDKEIVLKMILEKAIVEKYIFDYNLIKNKNEIVISEENIKSLSLPEFEGISFVMLSPKEIQKKADKEGDYLFLKITELETSSNKIIVSISNIWAVGKGSNVKFGYLSGGGFQISYTKSNGIWVQDEIVKMWIS